MLNIDSLNRGISKNFRRDGRKFVFGKSSRYTGDLIIIPELSFVGSRVLYQCTFSGNRVRPCHFPQPS